LGKTYLFSPPERLKTKDEKLIFQLGHYSHPYLIDIDNDGDRDLLIYFLLGKH